jgi:hypothetical protein
VRRFNFKEAAGGKERVYRIVKSALEAVSLPGPLEDLRLALSGLTGESGIQGSLISDLRQRSSCGKPSAS